MTERLAQKMMLLREQAQKSNLPSAIFGSAVNLPQTIRRRPTFRVGLWPVQAQNTGDLGDESVFGVGVVIAYLLERWHDVEVYPILVQLEGAPEGYQWQLEDSRFTPDDWGLDDLDENIAIWGELSGDNDALKLTLFYENDFTDDEEDDPHEHRLSAPDMRQLVAQLPAFVDDLARDLGLTRPRQPEIVYGESDVIQSPEGVLQQLFAWERQLLLTLWGWEWEDDAIEADAQRLMAAMPDATTSFSAWAVCKALGRAMLPGHSVVGDVIVPRVEELTQAASNVFVATLLNNALYGLGYAPQAYRGLTIASERQPQSAWVWTTRADMEIRSGRLLDAIGSLQAGIAKDIEDAWLYRLYGDALVRAEQENMAVADFLLIEEDDYPEDQMIWEAIAAYEEALELGPDDQVALQRLLMQLMELEPDEFWDEFERLVQIDTTGEVVRDVLENAYTLEDVSPAIDILQARLNEQGESVPLLINLAFAYIVNDQGSDAIPHLERAEDLNRDESVAADLEYLLLSAHDPEFEQRFAEISDMVSARTDPGGDALEFLEAVTEQAPTFADAYLVLAQLYGILNEDESALETLLDAQQALPDNPGIAEQLAAALWQTGERELAFQYLFKGLETTPNHVPLLVRMGLYLFESGQEDESRAFLLRAEALQPRHPMLSRVRAHIANEVAKRS